MAVQISINTVDIGRLANSLAAAGNKAPVAIARAINHTGSKSEFSQSSGVAECVN